MSPHRRSGAAAPGKAADGQPRRPAPPLDGAIQRVEVFPGNIGYLQINGVPPLPLAQSPIDAAFAFLRHTDALILDCRNNNGGDPNTVAYYLSYLTEGPPFVVNAFHSRNGEIQEFSTTELGQLTYGERKPVWVLISPRTFSGGEELAYDLQALRRARLIGEVTGGGANPASPVPLAEGFVAHIPFAHPVNPFTNANWEGRGVQPDVAVPAAQALEVALKEARVRASGVRHTAQAQAPLARRRPQALDMAVAGPGAGTLRGPNLITNGDFARGRAPWAVVSWGPSGPAPKAWTLRDGRLCTHVEGASHIVVRRSEDSPSEAFAIRAGVPYRLSFRVSASGRLPLRAQVRIGMPPAPPLASAEVPIDVQPALLHVDFRSKRDEPRAGVFVHVDAPPSRPDPGSEVCVDDFVLREIVSRAP